MSYQVEDLGKNMRKLTIEASVEEFEQAVNTVYQKNKNKINVQGFRRGKAPRVIEIELFISVTILAGESTCWDNVRNKLRVIAINSEAGTPFPRKQIVPLYRRSDRS